LTAAQLAQLKRMAGEAHKATPMLDDATIQTIADESARVVDADGFTPDDAEYTDTYDLEVAAAECWRTKAGMVAEGYDFSAEGAMLTRSQMHRHYLEQATLHGARAGNMSPVIG
jgi:hypothetical protein